VGPYIKSLFETIHRSSVGNNKVFTETIEVFVGLIEVFDGTIEVFVETICKSYGQIAIKDRNQGMSLTSGLIEWRYIFNPLQVSMLKIQHLPIVLLQ
jgi:hypothetical protein